MNATKAYTPHVFHPGDLVQCLDAQGTSLEAGAAYAVKDVDRTLLRLDGYTGVFVASRFAKVATSGPVGA